MARLDSQYAQGDWIVHNQHGVGQVTKVEKKSLEGEVQKYMKVETFNGNYWLPVDNIGIDHIRPIASAYRVRRALTIMRRPPKKLPKDYRKRKQFISETLQEGSLYSLARLARDLNGRQYLTKLNLEEEETLNRIKRLFLNEWVVISDIEREKAKEKLDEALEKSLRRIKPEKDA